MNGISYKLSQCKIAYFVVYKNVKTRTNTIENIFLK